MKEKIGNVTLDYVEYRGNDYYSEGSIEDKLLEIVKTKKKEEYCKVIAEEQNWSVLYHLSPVRGNIVEWLPISKDMNVLEIGSGCGAVTGALASKAGKVTCIELSKKRSMINAYQNREYDNIEIKVGNFQDIEENLEEKYDYITLIGVFEYAASYINAKEPYNTFLKTVKSHLKEDGKLVIAIENKFGLKYWAGCVEDHVGKFYEGIEGYPNTDNVRTFSKKELEDYSTSVGFQYCDFYYPYPDYKLPLKIFSDEYMPQVGALNNNVRNFDQLRLTIFDESKVFDQIIKNNMFDFFSNSFLVVMSNVKDDEKMLYTKYNERSEKFNLVTSIYEKEDKRYVRKRAGSIEAEKHLENIFEIYSKLRENYKDTIIRINHCEKLGEQLEFEYLEGNTLEEKIDKIFFETKNINEFLSIVKEYINQIRKGMKFVPFVKTKGFIQVFGDIEITDNIEAVEYADIDMLFSNVIIQKEEWKIIDYEWTFSFPMPFNFIIYRTLLNYVCMPNRKELYNENFFALLGISDEEIKIYEIMEKNFQHYVWGEKFVLNESYYKLLAFNYQLKDMITSTRIQNEIIERDLGMIVYFDCGNGFEYAFDCRGVKMEGEVYQYEIDVPEYVTSVQMDLLMMYDSIQIQKFEVNGKNLDAEECLLHNGVWEENELIFQNENSLLCYQTQKEKLHIVIKYVKKKQEKYIRDLIEKLKLKEKEIEQRNEEIKRKNEEIERKNEEIERKNEEIERKNEEIKMIYTSTSWKITKPLRKLVSWIK